MSWTLLDAEPERLACEALGQEPDEALREEVGRLRAEVLRLQSRLEEAEARGGLMRVVAFGFGRPEDGPPPELARAEAVVERLEEMETKGLELLERLENALAGAAVRVTGTPITQALAARCEPGDTTRSVSSQRAAALHILVEQNLALREKR